MKNEIKDLIVAVKGKIEFLINENIEIKSEREKLVTNEKKLEEEIKDLKKRLAESESNYNDIKVSNVLLSSVKDRHEAKDKINSIVREIDGCIALLNS